MVLSGRATTDKMSGKCFDFPNGGVVLNDRTKKIIIIMLWSDHATTDKMSGERF